MKVADLRTHLANLATAHGAAADGLAEFAASLAVFKEMDLRAFTALFTTATAKAAKAEAARTAKTEKAAKAEAEKARKAAEKAAKAEATRIVKERKAVEKAAKAEAARAEKARKAAEKVVKPPKPNVEQFIRDAGDLYDRGNDPSVSVEHVDELIARMESLTVKDLKRVADRIEMIVSATAKGEILKKMRERLANRVGTRVSVDIMGVR